MIRGEKNLSVQCDFFSNLSTLHRTWVSPGFFSGIENALEISGLSRLRIQILVLDKWLQEKKLGMIFGFDYQKFQ